MKKRRSRRHPLFVSWAPYCSRSDAIARELGGESVKIYCSWLGSNKYTIMFKYTLQGLATLATLAAKRPSFVIVMSPSVFANIPVFLYCMVFGVNYGIDAHTGAFINPLWNKVIFLQKFFCARAAVCIVTGDRLAKRVSEWGGVPLVVPDVPILPDEISRPALDEGINILVVNTFAVDEPLENILCAAVELDSCKFFVTGKIPSSAGLLVKSAPSNVEFLGFVPDEVYHGYMNCVDFVVSLTTKDDTMQRGAYEAIYSGKPVVTSDWGLLRNNFKGGAVFVDNSVAGIIDGVSELIENAKRLEDGAQELRNSKLDAWKARRSAVLSLFHA